MLKILLERWDENEKELRKMLETIESFKRWKYKRLVRFTFDVIYNNCGDDAEYELDTSAITEIDDGQEKGTLLYLIPFDTATPTEYEYLMTHIAYGSCDSCDVLERALIEEDHDRQVDLLMKICRMIIVNCIKPYNDGWRTNAEFQKVDFSETPEKGDGGIAPISSQEKKPVRAKK